MLLAFAAILAVLGLCELMLAARRQPTERQHQLLHAASNLAFSLAAVEAHLRHVRVAWAALAVGIVLLALWIAGVYSHSLHNTVM